MVVLEVVDLAGGWMNCREVVVNAVEMPLAPDRPARVQGVPVGELADLAGLEVKAMELNFAAALAAERAATA